MTINNNNKEEELHIVTEQGTFGDLAINDPSKKKVHTQEEMEQLIKEANERNLNSL